MGWPRLLRPLASRPHLVAAAVLAALVYGLTGHLVSRNVTRAIVAWDAAALLFIVVAMVSMRETDIAAIRRRALAHDEGRHLILILTLTAATMSVVAIVAELSAAKGQGFARELARVALAAGTIGLSWFFVQLVFAIHYAHEFFLAAEADGEAHRGGLRFPGDDEPDYWDFLYFAVVIGATAQTADVEIASKPLRRVATVHSLIAFGFNTAILATMINLAAGLF
jgi:uncharacterized membrane protein